MSSGDREITSSMGTVLIVEDDKFLAERIKLTLVRNGYDVQINEDGESTLERISDGFRPSAVLLDLIMPGIGGLETLKQLRQMDPSLPVIIISAQERVSTALEALREGAYDYLVKPVEDEVLSPVLRHAVNHRKMALELERLRAEVHNAFAFDRLIGRSQPMKRVFRFIERTLFNDITVLILGESGTGKELVAGAIHYNGSRAQKPFVVVNCAAIPRELVESELFGHEKGAFTGAVQRKIGKFELAEAGTLFLDEVGELELCVQAKLLRALQEREIERVGGAETIPVDVRLVVATQRDLEEEVAAGRFREDLFYRVNAFPLPLPPLRDRIDDIEIIANHFLEKHAKHLGRTDLCGFTLSVMKALHDYNWPGNVRQLENIISRAMVLADTDHVRLRDLPEDIRAGVSEEDLDDLLEETAFAGEGSEVKVKAENDNIADNAPQSELMLQYRSPEEAPTLEEVKAWAIQEAYEACNHNISMTAKQLGLGRATLYRLIEKYGIDPERVTDGNGAA